MQELKLQENSILIVDQNMKKMILRKISQEKISNVKVMTLMELRGKYYFTYDDRAIYYLMDKYNYQIDVAKMYLSRFYEVGIDNFGSSKIDKIIRLKDELMKENLLIRYPNFLEYLKGKKIIFYDCGPFVSSDKKMLQELGDKYSIEIIVKTREKYLHEHIMKFDTIEDEVVYVANEINRLVRENISFHQIKLCGCAGEYNQIIKRVFDWYNIPISFIDSYLYSTTIGQEFLVHFDDGIEVALKFILEKYVNNDSNCLELYQKIIQIINNYIWMESPLIMKSFLVEEFKKTVVGSVIYQDEVMVINSLKEAMDDDYVFLLGFNQGEIPRAYKDESYFNDTLKKKLGLETTNELNRRVYTTWLEEIQGTKNLIITMKETSSLGIHYLSSLNDDLKLEVIKGQVSYGGSHLFNQLMLGKKIDKFIKYGEKDDDLELLFSSYPDILYNNFVSNYHDIPAFKIKDYINHKLVLSYSSMNTYYQCSFRYYLSNILKLNIFEETFYTILGNLFHYILSIAFDGEVDILKEYDNYILKLNYSFNSREKFFLEILKQELLFVINTISEQYDTTSLKRVFYEEKITVDKNRDDMEIVFKGFVDKIMVNEKEDIISIIDYKTGNPDLNLNHIIYGLDLQLPVYIYLARHKFLNARIAGFYLQKILNNEISKDYKHTYEALKKDKLKLQGYSNSDLQVLEQFDSSYYESRVIKGMRTNSKGIASKKILNDEKISQLEMITSQKIDEAIDGILKGDFSINPKRVGMDNLGCKYCNFKDICFFKEEHIQNLREYKNMEFLGGEFDDTEEAD